ncbi:hypothetical protein [Lentzea alba]|nr:hypothetical protein [Lentzea alba]
MLVSYVQSDLNAWEANKFETDASLYWGGYYGPYGGTRDCY